MNKVLKVFRLFHVEQLAVVPILAGLLFIAPKVEAQGGRGFDLFALPREVVILAPTNVLSGVVAQYSNFVDRIGFEGIGKISFTCGTNAGGAAVPTAVVDSSPDQTNWVLVPYALSTNVTINYTNNQYSTGAQTGFTDAAQNAGLVGTNLYLLPGPVVTPSIASAGFGTPYIGTVLYTNTNSITLTANAAQSIGFSLSDASRYIRVRVNTTSNATFSAIMQGVKAGN